MIAKSQKPKAKSQDYVPKVNHNLGKVHVALSVYDPSGKYSQHAGVVITSIFENTHNPVIIYILHDETLTEDNKNKFMRTAEKYNQEINLIDLTEYVKKLPAQVIKFFNGKHISIGAFYRLMMPEIFPELDKIIYLDCDTVVNLDIVSLWQIDIKNYCLVAVADQYIKSQLNRKFLKLISVMSVEFWAMNISGNNYFNSGVLVLNLHEIRKTGNLIENAVKWFTKYSKISSFGDQDFLNAFFHKQTLLIDSRFNKCNPQIQENIQNEIIHTPGELKTWRVDGMPVQKLYWNFYIKSAWGENKSLEELAETMNNYATYRHPVPKLPKLSITKRALRKIKRIIMNRDIVKILISFMYGIKYRIIR